jgi:hypothetical protein
MNVQSMGNVTLPGDPGSMNSFPSQTTGSGDRPFSLLPLAMQVAAQTIGLDLVPVVPMQGPMGVLTYLDFVYGGGRGSGAPLNGALDTTAAPLMVKCNAELTAGTFAVNDIIYVDTAANAVAANNSGGSYELTYVGTSRIDGLSIFRVRGNTSGIVGGVNAGFTFSQGSETAAATIYQAIADAVPFYANANMQLPLNDVLVPGVGAGNNEVGAFATPSGLGLVKALEDHITGFSGNAFQPTNDPSAAVNAAGFQGGPLSGNEPYSRGVGESTVDNVMGLSLFNKSVAAETFQVAAAVTREQVQDLKQFGIDAVAQVEAVLVMS